MSDWQQVIGLEIHAQLQTQTKIFSPSAAAVCLRPNTQVREVDGGMPGALPVINRAVVECALRFGVAVNARINPRSEFARKNYFYPDLPKGYQISQYEYPVVEGGGVVVECGGGEKTIGITRAHLEEDAGKLMHENDISVVDLNRAGVPLLEIVSEPEMHSPAEAAAYAKTIRQLVRWLDICDGNMQEGSFRIDANISLRRPGAKLGTRCEIKNLNSFRFLEMALLCETARQSAILESGGEVRQQTLLFDPQQNETRPMRGKEDAEDYRYFPDPDLPPLLISEDEICKARESLPQLPRERRKFFCRHFGLGDYDAGLLTAERALADYFELVVGALVGKDGEQKTAAKLAANWILGELSSMMNKHNLSADASPVAAGQLAALLQQVASGAISGKIAKGVLETMWQNGEDAEVIIKREGLRQISDEGELQTIAAKIVADHPQQSAQYRSGKTKLLAFFVGQMMKQTQGKANPARAAEIIKGILGE